MSNSVGICDSVVGSTSGTRLRSDVWHHLDKTYDGKKAICKYCGASMGAESKQGTSHLRRHVKKCRKHQQDIDQPLTMGIRGEVRNFGWTNEKAWEVEVKKAIIAEVPFAPSECKKIYSRLMGLMDIDKEICTYYEHEKEKLANEFKYLTSRVCFSYEIMEELNYISITAHFINEDFNLVKKLIGFKKLTDISSKAFVAHTIKKCISNWKLGNKVFSFTGKDYSKYVSESLREDFSPIMLFEGPYFHVPCYKKGLTGFYSYYIGPLCFQQNANIENFIKAVKAARCHMDTFNQIAKERGLPPINEDWLNQYAGSSWDLDSKDPEHWEPAVKMFKEAILYKDIFAQYAKKNSGTLAKGHEGCLELENPGCNGLYNANLSSFCTCTQLLTSYDIDWERVEAAVKFSDKVCQIIFSMACFNYPTFNLYFRNLAEIEDIMSKKENYEITINYINETRYYCLCDAIWNSVFYCKENKVIFVACVLDPRYKLKFLKYYIDKKNRTEFTKEDINDIWEFLENFFGAYVNGKTNEFANPQEEGCTSNPTHLSYPITDGFSMYTKELKKKTQKSELEEYLNDELVDPDDASFNLLSWWKQNRLRYPVLSRMVRDVHSVPICTYSIEGNISSVHEGVSPELVEAVICSKDWIITDEQSIPESKN